MVDFGRRRRDGEGVREPCKSNMSVVDGKFERNNDPKEKMESMFARGRAIIYLELRT